MKAQARKILALIMAMVMCLSLAAPAMAADASVDEGVSLSTQAAVTAVTDIIDNGDGTITVKTDVDATGTNYTLGKDTLPSWIDCKVTSKAHVGENKGAATYVVSVASGYTNSAGGPKTIVVAGDATEKVKLLNTAEWTALEGAAVYFGNSEVKGYVWQEEQDNGKYRVFFKLATVDGKTFKTGDDDWKYFVAAGEYSKRSASNMKDALTTAVVWDTDTETATATAITAAGVTLNTTPALATTYRYTVINASDVDVTGTPGTVTVTAFATDKESGSFQVSVEATTGTEKSFLSSAADVETLVKKELGNSCEVESVVAASGNYFTVNVKKNAASADAYTFGNWHKGVIYWNNGTKNIAGLHDISEEKGGFYNAGDPNGVNGVQIAKGTELLGPVAVKASDVPNGVGKTYQAIPAVNLNTAGTYYIFNTVEEMKAAIKLNSCASNKTVSYVQLVMNYKNGTKVNGLVTVATYAAAATNTAEYVVTPVDDDWCTANSIALGNNKEFVKKDSWTVEAGAHGTQKTVTEVTKAPTCQEEGVETTKTVCADCGTVLSSTEKAIAKISDPIEINKAQIQDPAYPTDPTKTIDKVYFDDTDEASAATKHKSNHWINKYEVKTTTNGTVTTKTTTYTCNYGFVHDELTKVETINKAALQGAGKWNLVNWKPDYTIQNQAPGAVAPTGGNLFGYTVEVTDSDVDDATLPLNRTTPVVDPTFSFGVGATGPVDMRDGTFTVVSYIRNADIYASSTALPKSKDYAAVAVVKNISYPKYVCTTGTATLEVTVYEISDKFTWGTDDFHNALNGALDSKQLEKAVANKKVTLLQTYTQDVVIPAATTHTYTAGSTVCDRCGTSRESAQSKSQVFTADTITVSDVTWTGKAVLPNVVVKDSEGNMLIKGIDYEVGFENENATAVGEYTVVIKGIGDFVGNRISKTYKIVAPAEAEKKAQPMKLSVTKKTLKVKNLKKKAATVKVKVTSTKGKVTYKASKGLSVKKSGKTYTVTVKKGTKKGKYTVKWTAKGNTGYKKGSKTLTITVK